MDKRLKDLFELQQKHQQNTGQKSYNQRIKLLNALQRAVETTYRDDILTALMKDLAKPVVEAEMTEIYQIIDEIKYAKRYLHQWMKMQRVKTPLSMLGASSHYIYEPKGVCLIISPWNFPFNLTFCPLVSALAAGNSVILKPSEMTPYSAQVMQTLVDDVFKKEEVALVQGEVETSTALLNLPFNHIFFTGSPQVGKIVMKAASQHLSSVTLELGGKSPVIVDETANIKMAAKKIMWGKFMNCGQICVAPDYLLIHQSVKSEFLKECRDWLETYFSKTPETSDSYGRIVTEKHFKRLTKFIEEAKIEGANILVGGNSDLISKYIEPTLIENLTEQSDLLKQEIFGPILPIVTYNSLDEAISYVNSKERPLALYIFSKSKKNTDKVINQTRAGGSCINNCVIHLGNPELPFGGVNNSGIGRSHGFFGFQAFSNQRAILKQHTYGITELLFPPYNSFKEKVANLTIKWF